jgi:hypothetical protein
MNPVKCRNSDMKYLCPRLVNKSAPTRHAFLLAVLVTLLFAAGQRTALAAIFDFTPRDGVVEANYATDASRMAISITGLNQTNVPSGSTQDRIIDNGIVAWSSGATVYSYVFDPTRNRWMGTNSTHTGTPISDLRLADGVVAWSVPSGAVFFRVYDPIRGRWVGGTAAGPLVGPSVLNTNGVVAWTTSSKVNFYTYDPTRTGWMAGSATVSDVFDLQNADGVVAWSKNPRVDYGTYDPSRGTWRMGAEPSAGFTSDLSISNAQVRWTTSGGSYYHGYNPSSGGWPNSPSPLAHLVVSTNSGNAQFYVSFIDMSIGGSSWSLDFGDGTSVNKRAATHRYDTFGRFTARQTVNNVSSSTASQTILTDTIAPTGTLTINGGTSFTTNQNVTLSLTVSDNSPTTMRFANEGTNWSTWESFAATKAWALLTNNGTRSVSAQFRDVALNTSATVTASIQLDTSPLPVVSLVSTNVSEDAGSITLTAVLDRGYSRPVVVNYATSNNTATAGQDFVAKTGSLTFSANIRSATFTVNVTQDALVELNESFLIQFTAVSNVVAGPMGEVTILDDDVPTVSFAQTNYTAIESNGVAAIAVRLSAASGRTIKVQYQATNGTATADIDFVPVAGELTFPSGVTNQSFIIPVIDETLDEFSETVNLRLIGATNAVLSATTNATLTILDDDKPVIFFNQSLYPIYESNGVNSAVKINVRLSKTYTEAVFVECKVEGITASPGDDYVHESSNIKLNFQPGSGSGSTNKEITILVRPDTIREAQETIRLTLTDFAGGSPGPITTALIVITDDDAPPFMANPVISTNGQFSATFIGFPGQVFAVECSPNFSTWTELVRLTNTTGTLNFSQSIPTTSVGQFYRTRLIP